MPLTLATTLHDGHYRKASGIPYTSHLFGVMYLLDQHGASEDLLIAGLLHDVLEDRPDHYSLEELTHDFGSSVAALVQAVTKNSDLPSWQARAQDYLTRLEHASNEVMLLCLADKYHNLLSILMDHDAVGEQVWQRFHAGKERQIWWYQAILDLATSKLPTHALTRQYAILVAQLCCC